MSDTLLFWQRNIFRCISTHIHIYMQLYKYSYCPNKQISLHISLHNKCVMLNTFIVILWNLNEHARLQLLAWISINLLILYYVQHAFAHFIAIVCV